PPKPTIIPITSSFRSIESAPQKEAARCPWRGLSAGAGAFCFLEAERETGFFPLGLLLDLRLEERLDLLGGMDIYLRT
ncbi:MAG: hypothetical protein QGM50_03035, partial [Anaerolineae bacterium]|nr:hypothetical protein [Anaerolineae bacterium]